MTRKKVLVVMGTRPEAIKLAPVVLECLTRRPHIEVVVATTGQHRELLDPVLDYFGISPDFDLEVMEPGQSLGHLTARCIEGLDRLIPDIRPDAVIAQGDTTTTMAAAVTAFYHQCPFVHVEAGLRTGDLKAPWPEEFNRRVAGVVTDVHCVPTRRAADNLRHEHVPEASIHITGNTVVDALLWTAEKERRRSSVWQQKYAFLGDGTVVLVTGHRRENLGAGLERVCRAVATLADANPEVAFLFPVHLNPNVRRIVDRVLTGVDNIHLREPPPYPEFVWLMDRSRLIITDSGGIQEEAPSLSKPVVVTRDRTERPEAVEAGAAFLAGTSVSEIVNRVNRLLVDDREYQRACAVDNPFGDGHAARRIVDLVLR